MMLLQPIFKITLKINIQNDKLLWQASDFVTFLNLSCNL